MADEDELDELDKLLGLSDDEDVVLDTEEVISPVEEPEEVVKPKKRGRPPKAMTEPIEEPVTESVEEIPEEIPTTGIETEVVEEPVSFKATADFSQVLEEINTLRQLLAQANAEVIQLKQAKVTETVKEAPEVSSPIVDREDVSPTLAESVTVQVLEDGLTFLGLVWFKGQTKTFVKGTRDWDMTIDRDGNSWLKLTAEEQIAKYGRQKFRQI